MLKHRTAFRCHQSFMGAANHFTQPLIVFLLNMSLTKSKETVKTSDTKDPHTFFNISIVNNKTNVKT